MMHIDILCKICISIFDVFLFYLRYTSMGLKSNVTSASHKDWFYHNLIHASHYQKNFPNVYEVTVQSKICFIYFAQYI